MRQIERATLLLFLAFGSAAFAQTVSTWEFPKGKVSMVSLSSPVYPPLARLAHIMGDVEVKLEIRKDGSVASANIVSVKANVVSGNKMLPPAALDSAAKSHFECHQCDDDLTPYTVIYSFAVSAESDPDWPCPQEYKPKTTQIRNHVTLTVEPPMITGDFANVSARSPKCFYLWRCGYQWGGRDFYYYRAPSMKCFDMWHCGYKPREPYARCERLHRKIIY